MSDLVGNPEDRFSRVEAHILICFTEYSHPDFVLENQYTELCQRLPGYYQYVFQKCTVTDSCTTVNGVQVNKI